MNQKRSVYEYDNFREFLRDFCVAAKAADKKYSFRYFSRVAGFVSPSHIKRIIAGERNLSIKGIEKLAKALKLGNDEFFFFKNLVLFNQSETSEEKQGFAREILRSRNYRKIHPLSKMQFNYFSRWYLVPIRELVALAEFKEDPEWIAKTIKPAITTQEATQGLKDLIEAGLLVRDPLGKLIQANSNVTFPDTITASFYIRYHKEMLSKAADSIDLVPRERRDISNVTFGLSLQAMEKIKEMIKKFREDVLEEAAKDQSANSVYQLNLQLFPVAEIPSSKLGEKK